MKAGGLSAFKGVPMIGDDTNEPTDALTAAAVIARLNKALWEAKDKLEDREDKIERLEISNKSLRSALSHTKARLDQYENCDWPIDAKETPLDVIARLGEELAKSEDELATTIGLLEAERNDTYNLRLEAKEWEGLVANKDKAIEQLKITLAEEKELRIAWRKRSFDDDGWSYSMKVEHLNYINNHLRKQVKASVIALADALKFDPDNETEE